MIFTAHFQLALLAAVVFTVAISHVARLSVFDLILYILPSGSVATRKF